MGLDHRFSEGDCNHPEHYPGSLPERFLLCRQFHELNYIVSDYWSGHGQQCRQQGQDSDNDEGLAMGSSNNSDECHALFRFLRDLEHGLVHFL